MLRLGILNSTWIFAGEPARARREVAEARRGLPNDRFRAVHYQALVAESYIDVYDGEYERAYDLIHAALPAVRRSFILQLQGYRTELAALRGRVAIACAMTATGRRRAKLIREAMRLLPDIGVTPGALGRVNTRVVRLNAAMIRGRRDEALAIVDEMANDDGVDAWLSRNSARLLLGRRRGDASLTQVAEQALASRGGTPHVGLVRLYFPAFEAAFTDRSSPSPASSRGSGVPSSTGGP